ncbi:MAG: lysylphosphatidylglycerol synthase transmembrane domain-containing protein [Candidatus Poribacteria bacterium]|nr:lysylphosphatidylglycerol synthase transmembrane domain-containing protein [Candidatus Poribacteria bacterium]
MDKKQIQRVTKIGLPTVLAVVIAYFLLKEIDIQQIPKTLSRLSIKALVIGFGCYCLLVFAKALRFRALLNLESGVHQVFPILAMHTFWGNILPMRTGDVSYVYLMQRRQKVDATQGVASLLVASLIDLVLLMGLVVATAWSLRTALQGTFSGTALYFIPLLMGGGLVAVIIFIYVAPKASMRFAERCAGPLLALEKQPVSWTVDKVLAVLRELTTFRSNRRFLEVWIYSVLCLVIRFGFQCYLVSEMGVDIPMTEVLFALAFTNVFNLLPIQTVGNFGTTEFPFVWLLIHFGTSIETATVTGFSLHILILLYCLPLGASGFLMKPKEQ